MRTCFNFILLCEAIQYYQHNLLKRLPFLHCTLPLLSQINGQYCVGFLAEFSILFHWSASGIRLVILAFFWLLFAWSIFPFPFSFTFNFCVSLDLMWVTCRQPIAGHLKNIHLSQSLHTGSVKEKDFTHQPDINAFQAFLSMSISWAFPIQYSSLHGCY